MKLHYVFFLMVAIFITGLADGISWALIPIPGVGFVLAIAIAFCINITMGVGFLIPLLILSGMYHPRLSPFGIIAGLMPGINVLPFWVGLVVAGIVYKTRAEGGTLGAVASLASNVQSMYGGDGNPVSKMRAATSIVQNSRQASGRPDMTQASNEEGRLWENNSRSRIELKSPNINRDIARPPYAKAA